MPVVVKVEELVVPLRDDAEGVFEEGDDDEESADGGKIARKQSRHVSSSFC